MKTLYQCLYQKFPSAILITGISLGLSANFLTDVFDSDHMNWRRLVSGLGLFLAAGLFTVVHGQFATIESNVRSLVSEGGGIVPREQLIRDMLKAKRRAILSMMTCGAVIFGIAVCIASGLAKKLIGVL